MKVGIIEDSKTLISIWNDFLAGSEYEQRFFCSSDPEGLDTLRQFAPDVFICRGIPQHQSAAAVIATLRSWPELANNPIIVATASDERRMRIELEASEVDGFLFMPFQSSKLFAILAEAHAHKVHRERDKPLAIVVDDSDTARTVLEREMASLGFDTMTAANGAQGYELITTHLPDIALVDIEMPVKTGLELCEELAANGKTRSLPIIVISASVDDTLIRNSFTKGAIDFLAKPVESPQLAATVASVMGRKSIARRAKALVLEDSPTVSMVIAKMLSELQVASTICANVGDFQAHLSVSIPDIITLDLSLPDGDGLDVCRRIRENRLLDAVPVVVISAEVQRDTMISCLEAGANDYLIKPFVKKEFFARMNNLLRMKMLQHELSQQNRMLEALAYHDGLTGLFNRHALTEALGKEIARADRMSQPLGVILIDLDRFKRVNDEHGHEVGDDMLKEISKIVRTHVRAYDIPCRYGGEELCVLLPGASAHFAARLAERLRATCAAHAFTELDLAQTISVGVTCYPELASADEIIASADHALYAAKQTGRDRVYVYRPPRH